ncbi:ubiquinol-cytochrome C chaperone family protein [Terricaulis sp.]|uniref:ubiquinol-cytochrome C chaperone family protein n=1 Tax=Terricaulis sp. TaxID=2768686 RepID=UPI002AC3E023|nr:ubiquinol-cytochrome C chaperone family protein [Terricaulis sp.]MDZ4691839.1 ubiquinol-cytochrome C chaperone family protein [Terricaulis sp.]
MPIWPFRRSRASQDAERLLAAVTEASRRPSLFGAGRVPDTLEGRFELMTLNASLALVRLQADPALAPLAQDFTDQLFRQFDAGLREAGVGDTSVPKRMQKMASAFYGRLQAYGAAITGADQMALSAALGRNFWGDEAHPFASRLAAYAQTVTQAQLAGPAEAMFEAHGWPAPAET